MHDHEDVNEILRQKRRELKKLEKEMQRLEKLKKMQLKINSPEIKELAQAIQELAQERMTDTDKVVELVLESIQRYPLKKRRGGTRGPVPPKYRNPDNPSETWTGRGRQPKWVQQALERYSLDDLLIQ
ncbi:H-NS histone family protein [Candidatus Parcubacteria bacterium]|nr:MAG: H-NS histone family protein [Candidatus Parcubacteria bacterium]